MLLVSMSARHLSLKPAVRLSGNHDTVMIAGMLIFNSKVSHVLEQLQSLEEICACLQD